MSKQIRVRAKVKPDGIAEVKTLLRHEMETGNRKDQDGKLIPAHFITAFTCSHKGVTVMTANFGPAVSKNPYFSFKFQGANKGDVIKLSFVDNKGMTSEVEAPLK